MLATGSAQSLLLTIANVAYQLKNPVQLCLADNFIEGTLLMNNKPPMLNVKDEDSRSTRREKIDYHVSSYPRHWNFPSFLGLYIWAIEPALAPARPSHCRGSSGVPARVYKISVGWGGAS
jgi:hypothetical protein